MPRQEFHSEQLPPIAQRAPIKPNSTEYEGDVVIGERIGTADGEYLSELAFMEEPVSIRLEPSNDKNAATAFPVWVNGTMAECLINGRWVQIGYLPVGQEITVKRKVLEVIIRAKIDTIHTRVQEMESERPNNVVQRFTSPVHSFSITNDKNPRGPIWVAELRRRNL